MKKGYGDDLRVVPIHPDDPRCLFILAITGQVHHQQPLPWRLPQQSPGKAAPLQVNAIVAHVASEVGKLTMQKQQAATNMANKNFNDIDTQQESSPPPKISNMLQIIVSNVTNRDIVAKSAKKNNSAWRRIPREEKEDHTKKDKALTTQGCSLGAPREIPSIEDEDDDLMPKTKKINYQVPSLEVCLGKENLDMLREEELRIIKANKDAEDTRDADNSSTAAIQGHAT